MSVNSLNFFWSHRITWNILGVIHKDTKLKQSYIIYSVVLNILVSIVYPLHLGLSIFQNANQSDDIKNLTTFLTCLACSMKFAIYAVNFEKVLRMEHLLKRLDSRVSGEAELKIYNHLKSQLRNILFIFICIYLPVGAFAELSFAFQKERQLMYPAWFPFDWLNSTRNFYIAHLYQIVGISFLLMQNYVNDCFPSMMLCLISAHIKMLYKRFERIGYSPGEMDDQHQLEECITDHKHLLELFHTMETFMSLPVLIQIAVSAFNVCISLAGLIFFVTSYLDRAYFFFYAMAMPLQIFPICYYGMDIELWFEKLHYAAFSCNWIIQNQIFKRKLMIFVERSLKRNTAMAGGMLRIHVDTFFATLKFAYSLFTIILNMQN